MSRDDSSEVALSYELLEQLVAHSQTEITWLERAVKTKTHYTPAERSFLAGRLTAAQAIAQQLGDALLDIPEGKGCSFRLLEIVEWCRGQALMCLDNTATPQEEDAPLRQWLGSIYAYTLAANRLQTAVQQLKSPQGLAKLRASFHHHKQHPSPRPRITGLLTNRYHPQERI